MSHTTKSLIATDKRTIALLLVLGTLLVSHLIKYRSHLHVHTRK